MTRKCLAPLGLIAALLMAGAAHAQVGVPGNGPLTPDGPRRGLGPPSITDNVPDLRLQPPAGNIPSGLPPVYQDNRVLGGQGAPPQPGYRNLVRRERQARLGVRCRTPQRVCALSRPLTLGAACNCRGTKGRGPRGHVVR